MSTWYYYDNNGQKKGPFTGTQLRGLAKQGVVAPQTLVENEEGKVLSAQKVNGLVFGETTPSAAPSEPNPFTAVPAAAENPFTASLPHQVPLSGVPALRLPKRKLPWKTLVGTSLILLIVCAGGIGGRFLLESRKLNQTSKERVQKVLKGKPLELADFSVKWTNEYGTKEDYSDEELADSAGKFSVKHGEFVAKIKTTENLYRYVDSQAGLRKLGITERYEKEFEAAMGKYRRLSTRYQDNLLAAIPQELPQSRFCEVLVPNGGEVTLQGSITLARNKDLRRAALRNKNMKPLMPPLTPTAAATGPSAPAPAAAVPAESGIVSDENDLNTENSGQDFETVYEPTENNENGTWRVLRFDVDSFSCGNDFIAESKLPKDSYKLNAPNTKEELSANIRERKDFIAQVDATYDDWRIDEAVETSLRKKVGAQYLEITSVSVHWTNKNTDSASGTFTAKAQTTESIYKPLEKKAALEKLTVSKLYKESVTEWGIAENYEKELLEGNILKSFDFYAPFLPSGSEITLTGQVELSKNNAGDWQENQIELGTLPFGNDYTPESQLRNAFKLDDPGTKESVETVIKESIDFLKALVKQKDDFDRFCNSKEYNGNFVFATIPSNVSVTFDAVTENSVTGKIVIGRGGEEEKEEKKEEEELRRRKKQQVERPFKMNVNVAEKSIHPVTGKIDNTGIPAEFTQFVAGKEMHRADARKQGTREAFNFLWSHRDIAIQFDGGEIKLFISNNPRFADNTVSITLKANGDNAGLPFVAANRNWLLPVIQKWEPKTVISRPEPVKNGSMSAKAKPKANSVPAFNILGADTVHLSEALQESGVTSSNIFPIGEDGGLKEFTNYGTRALHIELSEADEFDQPAVRKKIKAVQAEIARKRYVTEYTSYSISQASVDGDTSSFSIEGFGTNLLSSTEVSTNEVVFPVQNITTLGIDWYGGMFGGKNTGLLIRVKGPTDVIRELVRDMRDNESRYFIRVTFKIQYGELEWQGTSSIDIQRIEVVKKEK